MKVYLVRHGESVGNVTRIHMLPDNPLSNNGIEQAKYLAKRFNRIPIDLMISSPFTRAAHTAEIISELILRPIITSNLFVEAKRPKEIESKKIDIPETTKIRMLIKDNYHNPNFRYSDEETFVDLKRRAEKALEFILNQKVDNILIVSHGDFIRMLVLIMTNSSEVNSHCYLNMKNFNLNNTGITLLEYNNFQWKLVTWNDQSHLN